MTYRIPLVRDTIEFQEIKKLISWLETNPQLTKGKQTILFQNLWNNWNGNKFSTYVNSGSSANLMAYYAFLISGRLKNKKVIVPALSWATTVAPAIQLGFEPIMCDCNLENYGLDIDHLQKLVKEHKPSLIVTVNVLGFSNNYEKILDICKKNNCFLIEDSCESIGTIYNNKKTGNFGDISTFSFYFGHHISTIEGGMVCTDDEELNNILVAIRSHGWDRDLPDNQKKILRAKYSVDDFKTFYTFYYPGFNFRSTDLQAFLGIEQLKKIDKIVEKRKENFLLYQELVKISSKLNLNDHQLISNFAFPIISANISKIIKEVLENGIETRPLICGSMGKQPFWIEKYNVTELPNANLINDCGIYLPNNPTMTKEEIIEISCILNKYA